MLQKLFFLLLFCVSGTLLFAQNSSCNGNIPSLDFKSVNPTKPPLNGKSVNPTKPPASEIAATPTIKSGNIKLTPNQATLLEKISALIKANPECKVRVQGYGITTKSDQQLSWDRVNGVIRYLVEKLGISSNRFIFVSGEQGDLNMVDLKFTTEDGPHMTPQPHPDLRKPL